MKLPEIKVEAKTGGEFFLSGNKKLDFKIIDFWRWNQSNLIENRTRGILAEFIVKKALNISSETRIEWDAYDLITDNGIKIEIKSASYVQSWKQEKYSNIQFGIAKTVDLESSVELKRQGDYYIFCLLKTKEQEKINPIDLNQWDFFVLKTEVLNEKVGNQKTIGLNSLLKLNPTKCSFEELKNTII